MTKPKLLWISDSSRLSFVGQSVVTRNCLSRLQEHYEIEELGFANNDIKPEEAANVSWNIIHCNRQDMLDYQKMVTYISNSKPDVVLFSHDPWLFPTIGHVKACLPQIKYIGYLTIDGEPPYWRWIDYLRPYDKIISPTNFGAKVLKDRWCDLNVGVVPYGLDHNLWHSPKQGKKLLKTQLTQESGGGVYFHDKFVALFIGANQDRKNLGLLHEAWREFERGKEANVVLLIVTHSASLKEDIGSYDLNVFLQDTKTLQILNHPQPDGVVARFMAAADILTHLSSGEGFGLSIPQAMACGTVPVILNFAGSTDFCNSTNSYEVPHYLHVGGYHVHRALADPKVAAAKFNEAYEDWKSEKINEKSIEGVKTAQQYSWERTAEMLKENIDEVLTYKRGALYFTKLAG